MSLYGTEWSERGHGLRELTENLPQDTLHPVSLSVLFNCYYSVYLCRIKLTRFLKECTPVFLPERNNPGLLLLD
jgi:hypothetical protein